MIVGAVDEQDVLAADEHAHPATVDVGRQMRPGQVAQVERPVGVRHPRGDESTSRTLDGLQNRRHVDGDMRVLAGEIGCFGRVLVCHGTEELALRITVVQGHPRKALVERPTIGLSTIPRSLPRFFPQRSFTFFRGGNDT